MNRNSLLIIVGIFLITIFLGVYLLSPVYLPNYSFVDETLKNNYIISKAPAEKTIVVLNLSTTQNNNTIYLISNTSTVYLQVINSSGLVANNSEVLIIKLYPGTYRIAVDNPTNLSQTITVRYGVFPYDDINSLYSTLGVVTTVSEFFITLGIVALGYGGLSWLFSKRRKRKK